MSKISYVNGKFMPNHLAKISVNDRTFHFSDAVYEVIPVFNSQLIFWKEHISRLKKSLKYLDIKFNVDQKILQIKCRELIEKNDMLEGIVYLHISRGIATRNHAWSNFLKPSLVISAISKSIFNLNQKPISIITDEDIRWKRPYIKSTSLLPNVLLKMKAVKYGAVECLLKDSNGYITEATYSNFFIIKNNKLLTTPLENNILPGVTRKKIIEFASTLKIDTLEKKFTEQDVYNSDGAFITNSSSFMIEVNKLNKKKIKRISKLIINKMKNKILEIINNYG